MKKIVLTGGGSAGHVIPALALLPHLKDYEIHYIGGKGIEKEILSKYDDIPYYPITTVKLRRSLSFSNLLIPFKLLAGIFSARKILKKIKPDVIFSKGGFVSLPVVIAAKRLRIPVIAHESDMTVGLANRIAKKYCKHICTTFETTAASLGEKAIFTGSPIRESIYSGDQETGRKICGFKTKKPMLLFMGGSLGAIAINTALRSALPQLTKNYNICHITGKGNIDENIDNASYKQIEFTNDIHHLFSVADIIIGRAGSNSACEILALRKPSLLIPLPRAASRGDQILNAEYFAERGLAEVLLQENLTPSSLIDAVNNVFDKRFSLISAIEKVPSIDGTKKIAEIIKQF